MPIVGYSRASSAFTPTQIAGLRCWLKADSLSLSDGDAVTTWADSSLAGNNATGVNGPVYKANILNAKPVVRFTELPVGQYFTLPAGTMTGMTNVELFCVVKITADPGRGGALWEMNASGDISWYPFSDGVVYDDAGSTNRKTTGNPSFSLAAWRLYNVTSKSGEWTSRFDGTLFFTTATNSVGVATAPHLGRDKHAYLDGDIAEFLMWDASFSASDRANVNAYIAAKYGLTIA